MKLVRYGEIYQEKPGLIDAQGNLRDLSSRFPDIGAAQLAPEVLEEIRGIDWSVLPLVSGNPRFGCPVSNVGQLLAIGLNYSDHAKETGHAIPSEPIIFSKAISCIGGPNDPVMLPFGSRKLDWEVELGVVIGSRARHVTEENALDYVAGYTIVNDLSEREFQLERDGGQWLKGKSCDTFGPIGPWLVTADEIPNPQALDMWLDVNGERMQTGSTRTMVFNVAQVVSNVSQFITLMPGDIIATGTPPGVGLGMTPPRFLREGDCMRLGIQALGEQSQVVLAFAR